jgi:hypothetical protein
MRRILFATAMSGFAIAAAAATTVATTTEAVAAAARPSGRQMFPAG